MNQAIDTEEFYQSAEWIQALNAAGLGPAVNREPEIDDPEIG